MQALCLLELDICFDMPKGYFIPLTPQQEDIIRKQYLLKPIKKLADELSCTYGVIMRRLKKWGLEIPNEIIVKNKKDSQYKKGHTSFNKGLKQADYMNDDAINRTKKTRFKKGNEPHNTKYDGYERITKDGYIEIRIHKGKFRLKHLLNWEKENGKLPKGYCLFCIDKIKTNTSPENWKLITRAENMYRNPKHNYSEEIIPSLILSNEINKKLKNIEDGTK